MATKQNNPIRADCRTCGKSKNHDLVARETRSGGSDYDLHWAMKYEMLKCRGCDGIVFRSVYSDETMCAYDSCTGEPEQYDSIEYFPPYVSRRQPEWISALDREIKLIMEEVYKALHSDLRRLATMGARLS